MENTRILEPDRRKPGVYTVNIPRSEKYSNIVRFECGHNVKMKRTPSLISKCPYCYYEDNGTHHPDSKLIDNGT